MSLLASGATDIGQKRTTNQDSICLVPQYQFFAVADGMGGHNGGDIASQMSTKIFPEFLEKNHGKVPASKLLSEAVKFINKSIYELGQKNEELKGMGTTISSVIFENEEVHIANVGDSRVYLVSNGQLFQLTKDHSLVMEKLKIGMYDRDGAQKDPQKNVLIKTVGFDPNVEPDLFRYKCHQGDFFLICSDGLHGKVSEEDIMYMINKYQTSSDKKIEQSEIDSLVAELINQANANGGQDNISVIAIIKS